MLDDILVFFSCIPQQLVELLYVAVFTPDSVVISKSHLFPVDAVVYLWFFRFIVRIYCNVLLGNHTIHTKCNICNGFSSSIPMKNAQLVQRKDPLSISVLSFDHTFTVLVCVLLLTDSLISWNQMDCIRVWICQRRFPSCTVCIIYISIALACYLAASLTTLQFVMNSLQFELLPELHFHCEEYMIIFQQFNVGVLK